MEMVLDYPGDPVSSRGPHQREVGGSESELEEAVLWAVRTEEGATSQGCGASRSWKRPKPSLPQASRRTGPAHTWV